MRIPSFAVCGAVAFTVGLVLGAAGCQDLTSTASTGARTTISLLAGEISTNATTSTTVTRPPASVTNETGASPCLVVDAFTSEGKHYVVVDYIQARWPTDENDFIPEIINRNPKLRTFWAPVYLDQGIDLDELLRSIEQGLAEGKDVNSQEYTEYGYWEVSVNQGEMGDLTPGYDTRGDCCEEEY